MRIKIVFIVFSLAMLLIACEGPIILDIQRDLIIDIDNDIFNSTTETNIWDRGLGVSELTINAVTDVGTYTLTVGAADLDATYGYTQLPLEVSGKLEKIEASCASGAITFVKTMEDKNASEVFGGWSLFANIIKAKLDYRYNAVTFADSELLLSVAPRGGDAVEVLVDSGVQTGTGTTDRAAALLSGEIAVELELNEHPANITVSYYTCITEDNLIELYDEYLGEQGYYVFDPWTPNWTVDEITKNGKSIGGDVYKLELYNSTPYEVYNPMGDGLRAAKIDLKTAEEAKPGAFVIIGAVITYKNSLSALSSPLNVQFVEIK